MKLNVCFQGYGKQTHSISVFHKEKSCFVSCKAWIRGQSSSNWCLYLLLFTCKNHFESGLSKQGISVTTALNMQVVKNGNSSSWESGLRQLQKQMGEFNYFLSCCDPEEDPSSDICFEGQNPLGLSILRALFFAAGSCLLPQVLHIIKIAPPSLKSLAPLHHTMTMGTACKWNTDSK